MRSVLVTNAPFLVTNARKTVTKIIITVFERLSKALFSPLRTPTHSRNLVFYHLHRKGLPSYKNWAGAT